MNDDELGRVLDNGPQIPALRGDAVDIIMAGASARRRRRSRAAIAASIAAVAVTIALITGAGTLLGQRHAPVPGPVAPVSSVTGTHPSTAGPSRTTEPSTTRTTVTAATANVGPTIGAGSGGTRTNTGPAGRTTSTASTPSSTSHRPATTTSTTTTTSSAAVNTVTTGTGIVHLNSFQLPSGNIGCRMTNGSHGPQAVCAIGQYDGTGKVDAAEGIGCPTGWNHQFTIDAQLASACVLGPVVAVPAGSTLLYGQTNVVGGIVCRSSATTGLTCSSQLYGVWISVNRTSITEQAGEGGRALPDLSNVSGSDPEFTIPVSGPYGFGSTDLSVVCQAQGSAVITSSVYCARADRSVSSAGNCSAADTTAQLVVVGGDASISPICGAGIGSLSDSSLKGKISYGTRFVVGDATCVAYTSAVNCSAHGEGFVVSGDGFASSSSRSDGADPATITASTDLFDSNTVKSGYAITRGSNGNCLAPSDAVRTDEAACFSSASPVVEFPCFFSADRHTVACPTGAPSAKQLVVLTNPTLGSASFPGKPGVDPASAPWYLTLADGSTCRRPGGPRALGNGQALTFSCSSGAIVMVDPDRSGEVWTVVVYQPTGAGSGLQLGAGVRTAVRQAWY